MKNDGRDRSFTPTTAKPQRRKRQRQQAQDASSWRLQSPGLEATRPGVASFLFGLRRARRSRYSMIACVAIQAKPTPIPLAGYFFGVHCYWMLDPTTAQKIRA